MDETGKGSEGSRAKKEEMLDAGEQMRNVAARAQEKRPRKGGKRQMRGSGGGPPHQLKKTPYLHQSRGHCRLKGASSGSSSKLQLLRSIYHLSQCQG